MAYMDRKWEGMLATEKLEEELNNIEKDIKEYEETVLMIQKRYKGSYLKELKARFVNHLNFLKAKKEMYQEFISTFKEPEIQDKEYVYTLTRLHIDEMLEPDLSIVVFHDKEQAIREYWNLIDKEDLYEFEQIDFKDRRAGIINTENGEDNMYSVDTHTRFDSDELYGYYEVNEKYGNWSLSIRLTTQEVE